MKNKKLKVNPSLIGIFWGIAAAIIIHGVIEIPILIWANRGGIWNSFLGFESYADFAVFDRWLGLIQLILGIILGYFLGIRLIKKNENKE